jgi:para-nitrobenzyl esterase
LTIRKLALAAIPAVLAAVGTSSIRVVAQVPGPADAGPVVVTKDGPVRGLFANGVSVYLGIPYAAPPVGDLRWRPPAPPARHGLIDATQFANTCPQVTELGAFAGPSSTTEDCLYLNVFTTGTGGRQKPVLVWIHGGGNVDGETNDYDGSKLATGGPLGTPIVVITMNYRMGLFGFLSESHLNAEGHPFANYGILDQQAVLRWVRANVAAFGGDPNNVTLGGQSAGAINTAASVMSPAAAGLFQRAIFQSSPIPNAYFLPGAAALALGNNFAAAAGCSDAACLRGLSTERILQLQGTANANGPFVFGGAIVDGTIVPVLPETAWTTGAYRHMPMLGGTTKDDGGGNFGLSIAEYFSGPPQVAVTVEQYNANSPAVQQQYPLASFGNDPQLAQNRIGADPFKCDARRVLNQLAATNSGFPVYGYDFTYQNAPYYFPQMPNAAAPAGHFQPLAAHTSDIQFVFQGYHGGNLGVNLDQTSGQPRELQGAEITLSDQIMGAWTRFAKTGNPNGPRLPTWQAFTPGNGPFLQQDTPNSVETDAQYDANYKCEFWASQEASQ